MHQRAVFQIELYHFGFKELNWRRVVAMNRVNRAVSPTYKRQAVEGRSGRGQKVFLKVETIVFHVENQNCIVAVRAYYFDKHLVPFLIKKKAFRVFPFVEPSSLF